ncbi:MAG: ABC transporter permease [Candidatus Dormibacteria bacterium]
MFGSLGSDSTLAAVTDLAAHVRDHLALAGSALGLALAVALPVGALAARSERLRGPLTGLLGAARVVPSLAILALAIPTLGIGFKPALLALVLLAIPPIAINTEIGLRSIPEALRDAAVGLGMSRGQLGRRIEWPLALPVVFTGIRTAGVEVIASASLAAFIGGGGLGEYIVNGLASNDLPTLLEGAIAVAVLALITELALGAIERQLAARAHLADAENPAAS